MQVLKTNMISLRFFVLSLLFAMALVLPTSFVGNPVSQDVVYAQDDANQALCESTDGSWTITSGGGAPVGTCSCPAGEVFNSSTGCEDPLKTLCESTDGSWTITTGGGTPVGSCSCPTGEVFDSGAGCEDPRKTLCDDTGGSWSVSTGGGAPVGSCTCEDGGSFDTTRGCAGIDGGGGGSFDSGVEPVDDTPRCDNGAAGISVSLQTDPDGCIEFDEDNDPLENNPIFVILGNVIQFLLAAVGIGLTAVVVIAGFEYMTARGDPQKTTSAKKKIAFAITGIILYLFAGTILNFLVPGGII